MTNELQIFNYQSNEVRVVEQDGEPWFVAKDVCDVLELSDVNMATRNLDDDEKGTSKVCTLGGEQSMTVISESGLYTLIMRSNKPEAKKFARWVTHEVLPSIRKTGSYTMSKTEAKHAPHKLIQEAQEIVLSAMDCKDEKDYQTTIAFDRIFKDFTGKSALEMAGLKLVKKSRLEEYPDGCFWTDEHFEWESDLPSLD